MNQKEVASQRAERARVIAKAGGIEEAIKSGDLPQYLDVTLSEALILGLLRQGVKKYIGIFGHGSTEIGEVLRVYEEEKLLKTFPVRHETEAAHAATALRWVTGEKAAIFTSIGPGAMHALAGSLVPANDGLGIWFLLGDVTTEDEGPNMQQIPKYEQDLFLRLTETMGRAYMLHTPGALCTALRRGLNTVEHPYRAGPFFLLLPMNTQPALITLNLEELPVVSPPLSGPFPDDLQYEKAIDAIVNSERIAVKIGGGGRNAGPEILEFLELADAVAITTPLISGIIPFDHERNMTVGGSKGSISGNYAMEEADCLVALGTRFVCQSDCSRTGYPNVETVININADMEAALHYGKTIPLIGDSAATLRKLNEILRARGIAQKKPSSWLTHCQAKRKEWDDFREERYRNPCLYDDLWGREVLTQPAAIKVATDWARENDVITFFDAGDVQANGFQIVEDDRLGRTFTDSGASYMGFAVSALLSTALASKPFYGMALSGDGSFTMNPQILIDGIAHGANGCIVILDNRRMGAISGLQTAQYSHIYATGDSIEVDYVAWAQSVKGVAAFFGGYSTDSLRDALNKARSHGLSVIHVPVYYGDHPLGGMGVFGRWNVGNWCEETQKIRHKIGL
jgi:3D-(3,5/4)-trihydroxycyclohexane-1,2-dione acylhydrolase (decyclizing)